MTMLSLHSNCLIKFYIYRSVKLTYYHKIKKNENFISILIEQNIFVKIFIVFIVWSGNKCTLQKLMNRIRSFIIESIWWEGRHDDDLVKQKKN